jgi:hypothetical protein
MGSEGGDTMNKIESIYYPNLYEAAVAISSTMTNPGEILNSNTVAK